MKLLLIILFCWSGISFSHPTDSISITEVSLVILGTVQDAGSPHAGCKESCCKGLFENPDPNRMVVSIGLIDPIDHASFLFEATPDLPRQMHFLLKLSHSTESKTPNGIFLTHAHTGHYSGLQFLGKEGLNATKVPVFVMPRMKKFLEKNHPWQYLVENENISLFPIEHNQSKNYSDNLKITPLLVPHRDELSETVGYFIEGPKKKALFIPDIDKWEKWDISLVKQLKKLDYAFIDGTFFDGNELKTRDVSLIPHPFVVETMALLKDLPEKIKDKVHFIHFNHTNELLNATSDPFQQVIEAGFHVSQPFEVFEL